MKLKHKYKSLFLSLLITNSYIISNAVSMPSDNIYETFESFGLIEVDDVIESQKVDLEIEGNTLSNIIDYDNATIQGKNTWVGIDGNSGGKISLTQTRDAFIRFDYNTLKPIEINKEYTLFINITKNTLEATNESYKNVAKIVLSRDYGNDNVVTIEPGQVGYIKYLYRPEEVVRYPYIATIPYALGDLEFRDFMIVKGNHLDTNPAFFKGMMSSGENDLNILTYNRNLALDKKSWTQGQILTGGTIQDTNQSLMTTNKILVKPNTKYTISTPYNDSKIAYHEWDSNGNYIKDSLWITSFPYTFTTSFNAKYIQLTTRKYSGEVISIDNIGNDISWSINEGESAINNLESPENNIKTIPATGLSKISESLKDRIVKKNGLWYLEKKLGIMEFDGSSDEVWKSSIYNPNVTNGNYIYYYNNVYNNMTHPPKVNADMLCDKLKFRPEQSTTPTVGIAGGTSVTEFRIAIPTATYDEALCREYLKDNPIKVVYELEAPIYEPLNIDLSIDLFEGKSYIGTDSHIPTKIKFIVDRTINKAVDALSLAQNSSSIYNISQARYWCNLLKESASKDYISNILNNILNIDEFKIVKESLSANSDIYIKGKNTLSLSIDTNNIIFDEYDGIETLEKKNAINLSISSSLPYTVDATLESEIYNKDKSSKIDSSILKIKPSESSNYQNFVSPGIPLNLLDNQNSGTNINHKIDIALSSTNVLKVDSYKTAIKFEVKQK